MILDATRVAQWWSYRTQRLSLAIPVAIQWLESGRRQPSSSTVVVSIQQEDNESI